MLDYLVPEKVSVQISDLKRKHSFLPAKIDPARPCISEEIYDELLLIQKFSDIKISDADKFLLDQYKLELMKVIYTSLQINANDCEIPNLAKPKIINKPPRKQYFSYLASGLTMNIVHGFVSGRSLLQIIPGIANPLLLALSGVLSILNGVTYYLFEGYVLKKNLGIPIIGTSITEYFSVYEQQIALTHQINLKLENVITTSGLTAYQYDSYAKTAVLLNQMVTANKDTFNTYQERPGITAARYFLVGFGAIMAASAGFFVVKSLLAIAAATLLGSPVGWGLIIGGMVLSVVIHMGLKPKKMYNMLNPSRYYFNTLKNKYEEFAERNEQDFNKVKSYKNFFDTFKPKLSVDAPSCTITKTIRYPASPQRSPLLFNKPAHPAKSQDPAIIQSIPLPQRRFSIP